MSQHFDNQVATLSDLRLSEKEKEVQAGEVRNAHLLGKIHDIDSIT